MHAEPNFNIFIIMNIAKLKGQVPDSIYKEIPYMAEKFGINTRLRLSHFLAQCAHESSGFKRLDENLNYSAKRMLEIFKKYFPTLASTNGYVMNPQKLGSKVYGGRLGNGPESTGEGYKYRGRGIIQLTGKSNYKAFSDFIGEDCVSNPDLIITKYPLASAAFFFMNKKLIKVCDEGSDVKTITKVTKGVNGGTHGIDERIKQFNKFYSLLEQ